MHLTNAQPKLVLRADSINDGYKAKIDDGLVLKIKGCAPRDLI
jgi:hypothetical protein